VIAEPISAYAFLFSANNKKTVSVALDELRVRATFFEVIE